MNTQSILEDRTITKRFLFPREKHFPQAFQITTANHQLSCYRQINHKDRKMLMVFHGMIEVVADYLDGFSLEIDRMGYNFFVAEYPGYSYSTGIPNLINILEDIPYIINNCGVSPDQLIIFGRSLGSAYAINAVGLFPNICGLIIESGVADFYERLNRRVSAEDIETTEEKLSTEVKKYFNIENNLKHFKGSTLIMHTKDDRIVNLKNAEQNFEWANEPKTLVLFDEGGHSDIQYCNRSEYFKSIKEFLDKC